MNGGEQTMDSIADFAIQSLSDASGRYDLDAAVRRSIITQLNDRSGPELRDSVLALVDLAHFFEGKGWSSAATSVLGVAATAIDAMRAQSASAKLESLRRSADRFHAQFGGSRLTMTPNQPPPKGAMSVAAFMSLAEKG
jgi:hypothetical protein